MLVLSEDEHMVLLGITRGATTIQISRALEKNVRTTEKIRKRINQRFGCHTPSGLLLAALKYGYFNNSLSCVVPTNYVLKKNEILDIDEGLYLHLSFMDYSRSEIADQMDRSPEEMSDLRKAIYRKWRVKSHSDLLLKAVFKGYILLHPVHDVRLTAVSDDDLIELWKLYRRFSEESVRNRSILLYEIEYVPPYLIPNKLSDSQLEYLSLRLQGFEASVIASARSVMKETLQKYFSGIKLLLKVDTPEEIILGSMRIGLVRMIPDISPCSTSETDARILQLIASGTTLTNISAELQLQTPDVSIAIQRLFTAWKVYNYEALILKAYTFGILSAPLR